MYFYYILLSFCLFRNAEAKGSAVNIGEQISSRHSKVMHLNIGS